MSSGFLLSRGKQGRLGVVALLPGRGRPAQSDPLSGLRAKVQVPSSRQQFQGTHREVTGTCTFGMTDFGSLFRNVYLRCLHNLAWPVTSMKLIYVFLTGTPVLFLVYFVFRRRAQQSQRDGEERGLRVMMVLLFQCSGALLGPAKKKKKKKPGIEILSIWSTSRNPLMPELLGGGVQG